MEVILNKDITKYKVERWKGLSIKQMIIGGVLLISVIGGVMFFFFICKVPLLISALMISPIAFGLVLFGFFEPDGMSYWAYLKKRWNRKLLLYSSIKNEEVLQDTEPVGFQQKLFKNIKQKYCRVIASKPGILIVRAVRISVTFGKHVYAIIKNAISIVKTFFEKIKQHRKAVQENSQKKEEEEAE